MTESTHVNESTLFKSLRDGRKLCYSEIGAANGRCVLFFHGGLECRLVCPQDASSAAACGCRVISIDRPGFGQSDFQPKRRLLDWAADVRELIDELGIDRCAVVGWSAGGPHALACAYALAPRITHTVVVSGAGRMDRLGAIDEIRSSSIRRATRVARRSSLLLRLAMVSLARQARRDPEAFLTRMITEDTTPPRDRELINQPEIKRDLMRCFRETFRQGGRGPAWDACLISRPWGIPIDQIQGRISLWYGDADDVVSVGMAKDLEATLPSAQLRLLPSEGHFLFMEHWAEILRAATT